MRSPRHLHGTKLLRDMHGERPVAYTVGHKLRAADEVHKSVAQRKGERLREILIPLRGHGELAAQKGYAQVLWLDGEHLKYVQEVGAMNMMFLIDGKLVTAPLHDTILPGITRRSVMTLAREMGIEVEERPISVDELIAAGENGKLTEAFGTGTAAVVSPVGELAYRDKHIMIGDKSVNNGIGELTMKLYNTLTGLQWGRIEDTHGWVTDIDKK